MPTIEELIDAAAERVFEKKAQPLLHRITILERVVAKNGDRIDTAEAKRISGIKENRTLKKLFTPIQNGEKGQLYWSRVEIETWIANKELTKYTHLKAA